MKKVLRQTSSVLCSIILFILLIVSVLLFQTNASLKSDYIQKSIKRITITTTDENQIANSAIFSDTIDEIYQAAEENDIPKEYVTQVLNSDEVKSFFGKVISQTVEHVVDGKQYDPVSKQELDQLIEENAATFAKNSGLNMTEAQIQQFVTLSKSYSQKIINSIPTAQEIVNQLDARIINQVQSITSNNLRLLSIALTIGVAILLIALQWKDKKWLLFQAVPILFSGFVILFLGLIVPGLSDIFISAEYSLVLQFSNVIFQSVSMSLYFIGGIAVAVAIIEIILYYVLKKFQNKKESIE